MIDITPRLMFGFANGGMFKSGFRMANTELTPSNAALSTVSYILLTAYRQEPTTAYLYELNRFVFFMKQFMTNL
jgi:hypothetical protein